ncbi:MAG: response regulator transcription factor [Candidatus Hydrogenedentes bacterium]|nr:response regulator transcription factor [Candidatus Hydrogenedentota bacterium]
MVIPSIDSCETRVLCVDDHRDIRTVLRMVIDAEQDMQCVGCLASADTLVDEARRTQADVVLLDATMPGKDPFEAMGELFADSPQTRTIIFSAWDDAEIIQRAIDAGAQGWVCKTDDPTMIVRATREVAAGETFFPTGPSQRP